jgi:hypothetical protein
LVDPASARGLSWLLAAVAALELAGLEGAELPTLACANDVDPAAAILVKPADLA